MTILRDRKLIPDASTADLVKTFNAMTGGNLTRFSSRAVAEIRTANAIMAAEDAAGHRGVPKGAAPVALTAAELASKAPPAPKSATIAAPAAPRLRDRLAALVSDAPPNAPKPKAPKAETSGTRAPKFDRIAPTGAGRSKLQVGSTRSAVMAFIATQPPAGVSVAEVEAHFGFPVRGYIGKLIFEGHVAPVAKESA